MASDDERYIFTSAYGVTIDANWRPVSKASPTAPPPPPRVPGRRTTRGVPTPTSTENTRVPNQGLGPSTTDPTRDNGDTSADSSQAPSPFDEIGASGLAQYGGFIRDEFLPQLQGDKGLRVFREMYDNDPIVGALVFAVQMLMRKVEWRVEPPESPTVEGIVQARMRQKMALLAQRRQAAAAQLAGATTANPASQGDPASGQPPSPHPAAVAGGPKPAFASPLHQTTPSAFHEPLNGTGTAPGTPVPPTTPTPSPSRPATPDNRPGANAQPNAATSPSTNYPARPDSPSSNPGGGPSQHTALRGTDGLPGSRPPGYPSAVSPDDDTEIGGLPKRPFSKAVAVDRAALLVDEWYDTITKAGGSSSQPSGGISAEDVGPVPIDPASHEPMDFPLGMAPDDPPSPEEVHAMEMAVLVETCLHDMSDSWADLVSQIITMIVYGFSFHEIVYKKRNGPNPVDPIQGSRFADGKIGWAKIAGRAQETRHRWEFDEYGNVLGMWQLAPPKYQLKYIPMSKALLFRTTGYKGNPEGRSILRSAYRPWYFKRRIEEYEAIGVERNLAGMPIAYVPYTWLSPYATPEEQAALDEVKRIVRNVRNDEQAGLVFPSMFDPDTKQPLFKFELVSASSGSGSKVQDTDKIIQRQDQRIAMTALVDFILIGHDAVGSKALAETKTDLFTSALEAWLEVIADVFNTYAIPRLMQMNGEDPAMSPRLTYGKLARIGLQEISQLITAMAAAGADLFPDPNLEDVLRGAAGLPPKMSTDDL